MTALPRIVRRPDATPFTREDVSAIRRASSEVMAIEGIAGEAAKLAGMTLARITGPDRHAAVVKVRDVICYRCSALGYSASDIARALKRDHSTILTAIRREAARRGEI